MKKQHLLKSMLLLCALVVGSGNLWATDVTSTFTAKEWTVGDGEPAWTASANAGSFESDRGVQWGKNKGTVTLTSSSFSNVSKVVVVASSNGSAGKLSVTIGGESVGSKLTIASGTANKNKEYEFSTASLKTGAIVVTAEEGDHTIWIKSISITYTSGPVVNVTGVTLDKTSIKLTVGDTETLTPTVAPADATNKTVSWGSDDEDVATVEDGVVTAVGAGTATITVTTNDGSFTDNCTVTVKAAPEPSVLFDFTSNNFGLPTSKTEAENSYSYGGYTVKLKGSSSNGYYYDSTNDNVLLGKNGATLTFPAFTFNVKKIKVYGVSTGSGSVAFNIYVGGDAVSTGVTGCKDDHDFNIAAAKQAAGTTYVLKISSGDNIRITKIGIYGYVSAETGENGYATFANSNKLDLSNLPDGLTAYKASVDGSSVKFEAFDQKVPENTGMMLQGDASETYNIPVAKESTSVTGNAFLVNTTGATFSPEGAYNYFGLKKNTLIFGLFDPSTVAIPADKAYLKVSKSTPANELICVFDDGETTGINNVERMTINNDSYYNLNGQRVINPTKGLYIVNGKKVIIK